MAAPIVNIKFLADLKGFSTGMQNASRKLEGLGKKFKAVGTQLSIGLTTPLVASGIVAVRNFDKQAQALAQVEQGLKSTGNSAGFTSKKLQQMASDLQNTSLFGDEEILQKVTAQLLTFTGIAGSEFERTQQAALDLSARLGNDLQSASIQLGKALNDPVANLSSLSESGIQFTVSQKETIKSLAQTNRLAEAQGIILSELEKQYGGSAAAAAKAGTGPLKQFANILGDISEEFGKIIVDAILPFVEQLKGMAQGFSKLSPQTKKFIVILGGVAAAIGPLLALAGSILPAIATGFTLLTGPIGIAIAALTAIGVAIYRNRDAFVETFNKVQNYFKDLYQDSILFRVGVEAIVTTFKNLYDVGVFVFSALGEGIDLIARSVRDGFIGMGDLIKAVLTGSFSEIPKILETNFTKSLANTKVFIKGITKEAKQLNTNLQDNIQTGITTALTGKKYSLNKDAIDTSGMEEKVTQSITKAITNAGAGKATPEVSSINSLDTENVNPVLSTVAFDTEGFNTEFDTFATDYLTRLADLREQNEAFRQQTMQLRDDVHNAVAVGLTDSFAAFSSVFVRNLKLANTGLQGFVKVLAQSVTKIISAFLAESMAAAIAGGTKSGAALGPLAVKAIPSFIASLTGVVLASFAAIPKFAEGGIVGGSSYYGDRILARLNSGELILNRQDQRTLDGMLSTGNSNLKVTGRIETDGATLAVVLDEYSNKLNRID